MLRTIKMLLCRLRVDYICEKLSQILARSSEITMQRSENLFQFGRDYDVYMVKPDKSWIKSTVGDLLPLSFSPKDLVDAGKTANDNK